MFGLKSAIPAWFGGILIIIGLIIIPSTLAWIYLSHNPDEWDIAINVIPFNSLLLFFAYLAFGIGMFSVVWGIIIVLSYDTKSQP